MSWNKSILEQIITVNLFPRKLRCKVVIYKDMLDITKIVPRASYCFLLI